MKTRILRSLELFKGTVLPVLAAESICWPWGPDTWQGAGRALSPFALSAGPLSSGDGPCTGLLSSGIPVIFQPRVQSDHPADSDIVLFLNNSAYVRRLKFTFRNSLLSGSSLSSCSVMVHMWVGKEFPDTRQNERRAFIRVGDIVRIAGGLMGESTPLKG